MIAHLAVLLEMHKLRDRMTRNAREVMVGKEPFRWNGLVAWWSAGRRKYKSREPAREMKETEH